MARLIAGLSFAHLALCYIYLYFLYLGFGGQVGLLFGPTDVLTVGLGRILPFYFLFFAGVIFNHLWMMEKPFQIVERESFNLHESLEKSPTRKLIIFLVVLAPAAQLFSYLTGSPILLIAIFFPVVLFASWLILHFFRANEFPEKYRLPTLLAFIGALQVATGAYAQGFSARHHNVQNFDDAAQACGTKDKVLFSVGDSFVVAQPDGRRKAVSYDCEEILRFERREVVVDLLPM